MWVFMLHKATYKQVLFIFYTLGKNNTNVNLILKLKERRHSQNKKHKLKE